jgi:isochorismate synthase EntC
MAKNNFLIPGLIIGGAAYIYYNKSKEAEAVQKKADEAGAAAAAKNPTTKQARKAAPKPSAAEKAFIDNVIKLQNILEVTPSTGFVGDKTKAALKAFNLSTNVTAANIADLITKATAAKKKPNAPAGKSLAQQAIDLYKKLRTSKIVLVRALELTPKVYNQLTKVYQDIPGSYAQTFYKGYSWDHDELELIAATTSNKIVAKTKYGTTYIIPAENILIQG